MNIKQNKEFSKNLFTYLNILDFVAKSSRTEATSLLLAFKRLKLVLLLHFNFCTKIGFTVIVVNNSLAAFLVLTALPPKVLNAQ